MRRFHSHRARNCRPPTHEGPYGYPYLDSLGSPHGSDPGAAPHSSVMDPRLTWETVEAKVADWRREAESRASSRTTPRHLAAVIVRIATPEDARGLEQLAELDSGSVPRGPALVAEIEGNLVAALPLEAGRALADPFWPTEELVQLLELRKAQLQPRDSGRRRFALPRQGSRRAAQST
jgi:hypothetical protein